jgi:transcription-repair coupling factor (superfamily II helicase)
LAERLAALHELVSGRSVKLIVNAEALLNRLPPPAFIGSRSLHLNTGETVQRENLTKQLIQHGYLRVEQVAEPGEFAVRGALIDIYAAGAEKPVRVDLFDDEVESLRLFDPQTQRSEGETERIRILPAREFPFDADAIRLFRQRFRDRFPVDPGRCPVYRDISEAQLPAGIEYYLPLFFEITNSLLDYLPESTLIIEIDEAFDGLDAGWRLVNERFEQLRGDAERPVLAPDDAFWNPAALLKGLRARPRLTITSREE